MNVNIRSLLYCRNSLMVKLLCVNAKKIIEALEITTNLKNAIALIANLKPEQYIKSLSYVKSLQIAKYIVKKYTDQGGVINYVEAMKDVPYYNGLTVHLDLNAYFIKLGADFSCFTDEYLQELYAFDPELRIILTDYFDRK